MAETHRSLGDNAWVEFKNSGYPFKLQRQLKEAREDVAVLSLIIPYVEKCHLPMASGGTLETMSNASDLDEIDEAAIVQLIKEFYAFRQERMYSPLQATN